MSEDFKYLGNHPGTSLYPTLDNLNVQKTVTQFNWSLWGANTKIYLKHVPASWSSDYANVVEFENKAARDNYLKTENPITLETEFRIAHDGRIRLPIPYDNLINYNYLVAEYPNAPVPGYETSTARKNYYYFIEDCEYIAPNTTEIRLELDIWTTYLDEITIDTLQLERGHYAMTLNDVDTYLANPINNCLGLGTIDVNFGELNKISLNHKVDLMGDYVYMVATTADPKHFDSTTTTFNGSNLHPGLFYFCVRAENWTTWVNNTMNNTPAFFQTIKGILILQDVLFSFNSSFTFNSVTCYNYQLNSSLVNYTFTKNDFGYDQKYQWLTKLYTSPYAIIEIIDHNGNKQQIKYEDLYVGKMAINLFGRLSVINPSIRAIVMNIGGLNATGDFNQIAVDIPIVNAAVNLAPGIKYLFETQYPRSQRTNEINLAKQIADQNAALGKSNTEANALTSKRNSDASAATGKTNANLNNDTVNGETGTVHQSNKQSKDFTKDNLDVAQDILDENVSYNKDMADANAEIQKQSFFVNANQEAGHALVHTSGNMIRSDIQMIATLGTMAMGAVAAAGGVASAGAAAAAKEGATEASIASAKQAATSSAIYQGAVSVAGSLPSISFQGMDATQTESLWNIFKAITEVNGSNYPLNNAFINGSKGYTFSFGTSQIDWGGLPIWPFDDFSLDAINVSQVVPAQDGLVNTHMKKINKYQLDNEIAHNTASYNLAESIRQTMKSMNDTISQNSYDQTIANNLRSYNNALAIALAIYNNDIDINEKNKNIALAAIQNAINQSYLNDNATYGVNGDISKFDSSMMTLNFHVKTQSTDAIARTGDYFLRYGYAYEGNVSNVKFNLMKHFTFWKAREVWLNSNTCNNRIISIFKTIFMNGVTVWNDPDEMGQNLLYDNTILN